jgi:hypothetical protein
VNSMPVAGLDILVPLRKLHELVRTETEIRRNGLNDSSISDRSRQHYFEQSPASSKLSGNLFVYKENSVD